VDSDLEAEYRLEVALQLPEEDRAFKLPKIAKSSSSPEPSHSAEPSNALALALREPMSGILIISIFVYFLFFISHRTYFVFQMM
jgi:hypothetical protein